MRRITGGIRAVPRRGGATPGPRRASGRVLRAARARARARFRYGGG